MVINATLKAHFKLHLVVLIFGFTAILGKLIHFPAHLLVWHRMLIAFLSLLLFLKFSKVSLKLPWPDMLKIIGVGLIVALHWITFFGAVKLSNVSITLVSLSTTTLFTSFLEPLFYKVRINLTEILIALLIVLGVYLIFQFETQYWKGMLTAISSAFLAGLFTVLNRKLVAKHKANVISLYEMVGGLLGISIYLFLAGDLGANMFKAPLTDWVYLLILGTVCTAIAFVVQVGVMKKLTAYIVSLTINLEPIYGIVLALILFGDSEFMSTGFYFGSLILLLAVFGHPIIARKQKND